VICLGSEGRGEEQEEEEEEGRKGREATRWRWVSRRPVGSSSRLPWVALNGGSSWLSRGGFHGLRLSQCCHGSHGFSGVNVIWRE
jgi:hypothetical protein